MLRQTSSDTTAIFDSTASATGDNACGDAILEEAVSKTTLVVAISTLSTIFLPIFSLSSLALFMDNG